MRAFAYGFALQVRLDLRSRTMLVACYLVPLLFFAVVGGIFKAVMPGVEATLLPNMTVFGVTMGALVGLPPTLCELYSPPVKNLCRVNGAPMAFSLLTCALSAFLHLLVLSALLFVAAPLAFGAARPAQPLSYALGLALFVFATTALASALGLAVKQQAQASLWSVVLFLPSILLSGIFFPAQLLPAPLRALGLLFPATWGNRLLLGEGAALWPLVGFAFLCTAGCAALLRAKKREK